ncbi:MAG: protein kinase [Pyrinomonadaceae bacterium]|nr:protein kinase [Pyrinomonadaceae bacterium]
MDSERYRQIKELFNSAVELAEKDRESFLSENCQDADLRAEIEEMLSFATEDGEDDTLEQNAFELLSNVNQNKTPEKIGNYKILREIGRGGMGAVYEAVRETDNFKQRVALKVIKRGMDTDAILSRFRHEQKILSSLEHPFIARFLDGGMTDDGLPFYAMEYVEGTFIDDYCHKKELSIEAKLKLFRQVCAAVQYAHQNLVIHRDLKPSNILVTGDESIKLLDFGIGKILTPESEAGIGTATELGMMTPAYASPEQIRGERIGTASDIYSLGVILYELLTGQKPYRLKSRNRGEMEQAILESEPVKPSSVVSGRWSVGTTKIKEPLTTSYEQTANPKSKIQNLKSLKGDLDTIILKSLRKESSARYNSAQEFSEDIRRYLEGLPISARPATFSYRAAKFVRRNRAGVFAAAFILLSLLSGITIAVWQAVRAERQRILAEKRFAEVRQIANNVVFKYTDAITNLPNSSEVREMLLKDASAYLDNLAQDAKNDIELQSELAAAYIKLSDLQGAPYGGSLGNVEKALENMRKAVAIEEEILAQTPNDKAVKLKLAQTYQKFGNLNYIQLDADETRAIYRKAENLLNELLKAEPANTELLTQLARLQMQVGSLYSESRLDMETARATMRQAYENTEKLTILKPDDTSALSTFAAVNGRLGNLLGHPELSELGDLQGALEKFQKQLEIRRAILQKEPENLQQRRQLTVSLMYLGDILAEQGKIGEAMENYEEARKMGEELFKRDANDFFSRAGVTYTLSKSGRVLAKNGHFAEGVERLREASRQQEEFLAEKKNDAVIKNSYVTHLLYFGTILSDANRLDEAGKVLRRGIEIYGELQTEAKGFEVIEINGTALYAALGIVQSKKAETAPNERAKLLPEARANLEKGLTKLRELENRNVLFVSLKKIREQGEHELRKFE